MGLEKMTILHGREAAATNSSTSTVRSARTSTRSTAAPIRAA